MATSASTLVTRTRRFVRDWPDQDALTASAASTATTVTVADATIYAPNWHIQIGEECLVISAASGTTLTVRRGQRGTTAASHANSAAILTRPHFLDIEILDALNAGLSAAFPMIYRRVVDESITTTADTYEYSIPDMPGITSYKIPYLSEIWIKESSDPAYRRTRAFRILRDETTPKVQFRRTQAAGATIRLVGYGPYAALISGASLGNQFPPNAEDLLVWFAGNYLLASGEAGRVRVDTGASTIDEREQANRTGSSMTAANALFQRYQIRLRDAALPPMPKHVIATF